jgi:hypothetical protein
VAAYFALQLLLCMPSMDIKHVTVPYSPAWNVVIFKPYFQAKRWRLHAAVSIDCHWRKSIPVTGADLLESRQRLCMGGEGKCWLWGDYGGHWDCTVVAAPGEWAVQDVMIAESRCNGCPLPTCNRLRCWALGHYVT